MALPGKRGSRWLRVGWRVALVLLAIGGFRGDIAGLGDLLQPLGAQVGRITGVVLLIAVAISLLPGAWRRSLWSRRPWKHDALPTAGGEEAEPSSTEADQLISEFSGWVRTKRAALPDWPGGGRRGGLSTESPVYQAYDQTRREVHREARIEYHHQFRARVVALLGEDHERTSDPRTIDDLQAVERLLRDRTRASRPGDTPIAQPEADETPVERLRDALRQGLALRTRLAVEINETSPLPISEDSLYVWANETHDLLREHFPDRADAFYGDDQTLGSAYFMLAFSNAVKERGRSDYLEGRIGLLKKALDKAG